MYQVLRRAATESHEDLLEELLEEINKLELAAKIVRPLIASSNQDKLSSLAEKERIANLREKHAFMAGVQVTEDYRTPRPATRPKSCQLVKSSRFGMCS